MAKLPASMQSQDPLARATLQREINNAMSGGTLEEAASPEVREAAHAIKSMTATSDWARLGAGLLLGLGGFLWGASRLNIDFRARNAVEKVVHVLLFACSAVAVLTTIGIVFSVLFETLRFFGKYPWNEFLFGLQWSPQIAMRADQVGQSGAFGLCRCWLAAC